MSYTEFIDNILNTRERFQKELHPENYYERHHIKPRCLGGTNDDTNLIDLTAREHFIAHKLLAEENPNAIGLNVAFLRLATDSRERNITAEEYEEAKIGLSNARKGVPCKEETKQKIRKTLKGKPLSPEAYAKNNFVRGLTPHRTWHDNLAGKPMSESHKKAISEAMKGKKFSEEHKQKLSEAAKNRDNTNIIKGNKERIEQRQLKRIEEYSNHPNTCPYCKEPLEYIKRHAKHCDKEECCKQFSKDYHAICSAKASITKKSKHYVSPNAIKVYKCDLKVTVIEIYSSITEAYKVCGHKITFSTKKQLNLIDNFYYFKEKDYVEYVSRL